MKNRYQSFTLIEILAAIGIIGVLVGLGFGAYSYANNRSKEAATRSMIQQLSAAFENAKNKHGFYMSSGVTNNESDYKYIYITNSRTGIPEYGKIAEKNLGNKNPESIAYTKTFLETLDIEQMRPYLKEEGSSLYIITDAWGGPIYFKSPGNINASSFDLYAPGPDGRFGESQDDKPKSKDKTDYINSDDVTNF